MQPHPKHSHFLYVMIGAAILSQQMKTSQANYCKAKYIISHVSRHLLPLSIIYSILSTTFGTWVFTDFLQTTRGLPKFLLTGQS